MPWMSLDLTDSLNQKLRDRFSIFGIPALVILDAQSGFVVTETARKDIKKNVNETYEAWEKLLELKKARAVRRAEEDAAAATEKAEREYKEKMKKEAERMAAEGGKINADVA